MWTFENSSDNWWGLDEKLLEGKPEYIPDFQPMRDWISTLKLSGNTEDYVKKLVAAGFRNPDHLLLLEPTENDFRSAGIVDQQDLEKIKSKIQRDSLRALLLSDGIELSDDPGPEPTQLRPHELGPHEEVTDQEEVDNIEWEDSHAYTAQNYGKHYEEEAAYYTNQDPYKMEQQQEEDLDELIRQTQAVSLTNELKDNGLDLNDLMLCGLVDESGAFSFQHDVLLSLVQPIEEQIEYNPHPRDISPSHPIVPPMPSIPSLPSLPQVPSPALPGLPSPQPLQLPPSPSTEYFRTLPSISLEAEDLHYNGNPLYTDKP